MAMKRYRPEEIIKILKEAASSLYVGQSCGDASSHSRNEGEFNNAS